MALSITQFEELYRSNHKQLCLTANRIVNNRDFAEDIVQDVFLKLWDLRDEINVEKSYGGYLYKATTNAALNFLQSKLRFIKFSEEAKASASLEETISQNISAKELELYIDKAIHRLPPKCRAIFVLSRFEGMRYKQIAEHFDISVSTVENQMVKALEMLREELKPFLSKEFLVAAMATGLSVLLQLLSLILIINLFNRLF